MNTLTPYIKANYKLNSGETPVYIRLYLMQKRVLLPTNVKVKSNAWSHTKNQVLASDPDYKDKNLQIKSSLARCTEILKRYRLQFKEITPELIREEYKIFSTYIDFYDFMEKAVQTKKGISSIATIKKHNAVLGKLKEFKSQLMFSEINLEFINSFDKYLKLKLGNKTNTRVNNLKIFKSYLEMAVRKEIIKQNPFGLKKLSRQKVDKINLTSTEVNKLIYFYRQEQFSPNLHKVLRLFLFACVTGVRISDIFRIRHEGIYNGVLSFIPQKTLHAKSLNIDMPLTPFALELIRDQAPQRISGFIFDRISNPHINRCLKDIMDYVNIKKTVTFHSGRHTFATLFLEKGGSVEVLQKLLGHSSIINTMVYVHVSKKRIIDQMTLFGNNL